MAQRSDFRIIPEQGDLAAIPRDLRFHPSTTREPRQLSAAQIEQFNRDGYLKGLRVLDDAEVLAQRRAFDALLARALAAGGDSYSISSAHLKYGTVYDLLTHSRIVAIVRDLLGNDVIGWGAHYFCKMPGDGKRVAWHQDASYWPLTPSKAITVWLAIDDSDRGNACMRVVPGSHWHGHLTYRLSEADESNVLDQTVENAEGVGTPIDLELRAGEVSIHSDLLLHGSEANCSDRRRCGLTLRYCTPDVTAHLGWYDKGVHVCGTCPPNRWANRQRPSQD